MTERVWKKMVTCYVCMEEGATQVCLCTQSGLHADCQRELLRRGMTECSVCKTAFTLPATVHTFSCGHLIISTGLLCISVGIVTFVLLATYTFPSAARVSAYVFVGGLLSMFMLLGAMVLARRQPIIVMSIA